MAGLIGQSLGRYHILEQLGQGGMAVVYKAYDMRLERDVAIKVIRVEQFSPATLQRVLARFEREAKSLGKLSHPNIVGILDYGDYEDVPYLVMEYLPGGTLKQRLGRPVAWEEAARLVLPIARGLAYAHQRGIIHRDVKPSNILITESGEPMLSDFGIAKILESDEATSLTGTGMGVGTPEYMAPEQWTGKTNAQSDQYSLGVVFYEMVTGRKPYLAETPAAIMLKQATEPLPRPRQFARDLPEPVEKMLIKALARNAQDRFGSMSEFATAMENLAREEKALGESKQSIPSERVQSGPLSGNESTASQVSISKYPTSSTNWGKWIVLAAGGILAILLLGVSALLLTFGRTSLFDRGSPVLSSTTNTSAPIPQNHDVRLFVTNGGADGGISVIDTTNNSVITTISTGSTAQGIASRPDRKVAYSADSSSNRISVIDLINYSVITTISVDIGPVIPAVSHNGGLLFVTNFVSNSISVIDTSSNNIITTIKDVPSPWGIAVSPDDSRIAVTLYEKHTVSIYNTSTFTRIADIAVGKNPEGIIYQPHGSRLYVANLADSSVSVIDTESNKVVATIPVGSKRENNPVQFAFNSDATKLFVANDLSSSVSEIEVTSGNVLRDIDVGLRPRDIAVINQYLYVTNSGDNSVSVVDLTTGKIVKTITGFDAPHSITP